MFDDFHSINYYALDWEERICCLIYNVCTEIFGSVYFSLEMAIVNENFYEKLIIIIGVLCTCYIVHICNIHC